MCTPFTRSHSSRVRGLKSSYYQKYPRTVYVALLASAWIEILPVFALLQNTYVALLASAWIEISVNQMENSTELVALLASAWIEIIIADVNLTAPSESHSSRVRGLKYCWVFDALRRLVSHSSRVRGLKFFSFCFFTYRSMVALLASAWIERIAT